MGQIALRDVLRADWAAAAAPSPTPLAFAFPQFFAVACHRLSNALWRRGRSGLSRGVMVIAEALTGAEISGTAQIGPGLRLTHTSGIVVGGGVVAGAGLTLYSGVVLGNFSPERAGQPTLGDDVRVCSKASVLGPVHVGDGALIGAHALVVEDVAAGATVRAPVAVTV